MREGALEGCWKARWRQLVGERYVTHACVERGSGSRLREMAFEQCKQLETCEELARSRRARAVGAREGALDRWLRWMER